MVLVSTLLPTDRKRTGVTGVTVSRDVDSHVSGTPQAGVPMPASFLLWLILLFSFNFFHFFPSGKQTHQDRGRC